MTDTRPATKEAIHFVKGERALIERAGVLARHMIALTSPRKASLYPQAVAHLWFHAIDDMKYIVNDKKQSFNQYRLPSHVGKPSDYTRQVVLTTAADVSDERDGSGLVALRDTTMRVQKQPELVMPFADTEVAVYATKKVIATVNYHQGVEVLATPRNQLPVTREFIDSVDVLLHAHAEAIGLAEPGKLCM
jgi:hypothetical protein